MKSVKGERWFESGLSNIELAHRLIALYKGATLMLGSSDRYKVKMIVSKPEGIEEVVNQKN